MSRKGQLFYGLMTFRTLILNRFSGSREDNFLCKQFLPFGRKGVNLFLLRVCITIHKCEYVCVTGYSLYGFNVRSHSDSISQITMPQRVRCSTMKIDCFVDSIPHCTVSSTLITCGFFALVIACSICWLRNVLKGSFL